ncbi:MAG: tRNA(adenine34) deaminase [Candidatus Azotimanducaceae bacterium]
MVIGAGFNQTISQCDPTAHAEIVAIRAAATLLENYRLVGAELFVTIEPCTMCAGALVQSRIKRVIFGAAEPRAGALCSSARVLENPGLNHRVDVVSGIRAAQAARLMSDFFKDRR